MTFVSKPSAVSVLCNGSENCQTEVDGTQEIWRTLMAVYLGVILLLSVCFNSTICFVFYKKSHLLSISNCFILNLACCQLCMSLLVLPFSLVAVVSHNLVYSGIWCQLQGFVSTVIIITLQLNLLVISLDRNYAIMNSLRYNSVFTQRLCTILNSGSWAFGVVLSIPPLLKVGMADYTFQPYQFICALNWGSKSVYLIVLCVIVFAAPILMESLCYVRIFMAAVSHTKRTARVYPSVSVTRTSTYNRDAPSNSSDSSEGTTSGDSKYYAAGCKAVRTIFLIALFYSICWVPYFINLSLMSLYDVTRPHLSAASICLLYSSGILNPIIYVYLNRVIRREIGKFLCGTTTRNDTEDYISTSMSTFSSAKQTTASAWSTHQRTRSKSAGGAGNEMDTIVEESEVFETLSVGNLQVGKRSVDMAKDLVIRETTVNIPESSVLSNMQSCTKDESKQKVSETEECMVNQACSLPINPQSDKTETNVQVDKSVHASETSVQCSNAIDIDTDFKQRSTVTIKSESKDNVRRDHKRHGSHHGKKLARSNSFAYFSKKDRKKKRDCGSFLFFEHDDTLDQAHPSQSDRATDSEREERRTNRYSLDHKISMTTLPKILKFRLSLRDNSDSVNKVTVRSNVRLSEAKPMDNDNKPSVGSESESSCGIEGDSTSSENLPTYSTIEVKPTKDNAWCSIIATGSLQQVPRSPLPSPSILSVSKFPTIDETQTEADV